VRIQKTRRVVMDGGKIVAEGGARELIERHSTRDVLAVGSRRRPQAPMPKSWRTIGSSASRCFPIGSSFDAPRRRRRSPAGDGSWTFTTRPRAWYGAYLAGDVFLHLTGRTLVSDGRRPSGSELDRGSATSGRGADRR